MHRLLFALPLLVVLLTGCDSSDSEFIYVSFYNDSNQPVHMMVTGRPFSPDNRVSAFSDSAEETQLRAGESAYSFSAGTNGTVSVTTNCVVSDPQPSETAVRYTEGGQLNCERW